MQLSKVDFDRYDELLLALTQALEEIDNGLLEPSEVYRVCIATKLPLAGGTMTGAIAMGTNKITGAGEPTAAQDVATTFVTVVAQ